MHPAKSIIYFTSASGLGFGLLFFLGIGMPHVTGMTAFWFYLVGYGLAVTGLLSSLLHLGNPQRAWKALSQWRTSWLSREGVAAVAALLCLAPHAFAQVFFSGAIPVLGWIGAIFCALTIVTTSMLYGQLKTVPRWNQPLTPALFLSFAFAGGALLACQWPWALAGLLAVIIVQIAHWVLGDRAWNNNDSTAETATGLGHLGTVRLLERPHTGKSYLTTEMVHVLARKHGMKLRVITLILFVVAFLVALAGGYALWGSVLIFALGMLVSRWLFFAEAEHVVGLYYGRAKGA